MCPLGYPSQATGLQKAAAGDQCVNISISKVYLFHNLINLRYLLPIKMQSLRPNLERKATGKAEVILCFSFIQ